MCIRDSLEPLGEAGARHRGRAGQFGEGPGAGGVGVHQAQGGREAFVGQRAQQSGRVGVGTPVGEQGAQDLDQEQRGEVAEGEGGSGPVGGELAQGLGQ